MKFLDKQFKLKENGTTVKTEIIAGLTTFFTMAYILFVNPSILSASGMSSEGVLFATCIASAIGCFLMAFLANYPFALAPGLGLNAYFAYTVCLTMGISYQGALAAVFISGMVFIILTVTGAREAIINAIPSDLKKAISVGIGMFIAYIGFTNSTLVIATGSCPVINLYSADALIALVGLVITVILMAKNVKGSIFIGIVITSIIAIVAGLVGGDAVMTTLGIYMPTSWDFTPDVSLVGAFITGFGDLFGSSNGIMSVIFTLITILISFTMIDLFDTVGTLVGAAQQGGMLDEEGKLPRAGQCLMADAVATSVGAVMGTSTVTTFVESTSGISAGGKTGLTAATVGVMFLLSILFTPILGMVASAACAPALIIVGILMMGNATDIDWKNFTVAVPCFLTILVMTVCYSISDGIAMGFFFYVIMQVCTGKGKEVSPVLYVVTVLFALKYVIAIL
ncbi:MAG: NCS2 family permease [Bacillota bacterium]